MKFVATKSIEQSLIQMDGVACLIMRFEEIKSTEPFHIHKVGLDCPSMKSGATKSFVL